MARSEHRTDGTGLPLCAHGAGGGRDPRGQRDCGRTARGLRSSSLRFDAGGMIEIGIIGCGAVVERNYVPTLRGRSEYAVRFVADTSEERAARAAELFGAEPVSV